MKKIISLVFVLLLIGSAGMGAHAKTSGKHDYILDKNKRVPIPVTHESIGTVEYIPGYEPDSGDVGHLNNPKDMEVDEEGNLYITDTGNNAVLKLSPEGQLLFAVKEAGGIPVSHPIGLFVDKNQEVFFADNGNQRIVHLSADGAFIEAFTAPKSELLSQNLTTFDPSKIGVVDYTGYIYLLIGKEFLALDASGEFKGLVGTEPVGFNLSDWIARVFLTETQKEKLTKREPVSYNNFCVTRDNKIYAVSMAASNQIKKINISGENTYPAGLYGQVSLGEKGELRAPYLVDIAVNSYGVITVADQNTSLLYQYNSAGELLAVFGGQGSGKGLFQTISAICYDSKDQIYVLDSAANRIQIMGPTTFLRKVHYSVQLYLDGEYDASLSEWQTMLQQIGNYPIAQNCVADILYRKGDYKAAMQQSRESGNRAGYATVFAEVRSTYLSAHFLQVTLIAAVLIAVLFWLALYMHRYCVWVEEDLYSRTISRKKEFLGLCQMTIFHPLQGWDLLKWRRIHGGGARLNLLPIIILPLLAVISRFISSRFTAFSVAVMDSGNASVMWDFLLIMVPYITLGIAIYKIFSVFSGEITLYETFAALAYSLIPMIVFLPLLTALSHLVVDSEVGLFHAASVAINIWTVALGITAVYRINDISAKRTAGISLLCVFGTALVWVLCMLIYIFSAQLWYFVSDLFSEAFWRIRGV